MLRIFAALGLAAGISFSLAAPAEAIPVKVAYSFFYQPPVEDLEYPADSTLAGTLQFFSQSQSGTNACGGAITIGATPIFTSTGGSFTRTDPCFGDPAAELLFSFNGQVSSPTTSTQPQIYAFPTGTANPSAPPADAIDLGSIGNGDFGGAGPLYGFASPGQYTGTWTINVTQLVPEPPTLPLLAAGIGFALLRRLKRRART
jgi:hypothetical protein